MTKKQPRRPRPDAGAAGPPAPAPEADLPDVDTALTELARRHVRLYVALFIRVVAVALLVAVLSRQMPALRAVRPVVDALSGVLVLWPFFTAFGRLQAWRIALGRSYAGSARWAEAEQTLAPLAGARGQLFDAAGEGRYHLALSLREQGRTAEADRLLAHLAALPGGEWAERARRERQTSAPE